MKVSGITTAKLIASAMLLGALGRHPYAYYTVLRWMVSGVSSFSAVGAAQGQEVAWAWILGIAALVFNPFLPLRLGRETWALVDVATAIVLIASVITTQRQEVKK